MTTSAEREREQAPDRPGSLLAQRDFRSFWLGETANGFASYATTLALPLIAVTMLDASPFTVGLLSAAVWLPWLAIGLPAGAWVDRMARKPVMIACNVVSAAVYVSVPIFAWLGLLTIGQLIVVAIVVGAASVFFTTAYHAHLPDLVGQHQIMEGNAKIQGSESTMQLVGPSISGVVSQALGAATGLLTNVAGFVFAAICMARIPGTAPADGPAPVRPGLRSEVRQGFRFVVRDPYLRPLVIYGALANLAIDGYTAVQVPFLIRTIGVNSAVVGILMAAGGVGGILGSLAIRPITRRFGTSRGLLIAKTVAAPFGLLMAMTGPGPGVLSFAIGLMMIDGSIVTSSVVLGSFRQLYCPPALLGRVVATTTVIKYSTIPVGAVLGGLLGSVVGLRPTMWIMTSALMCCTGVLYWGPMRHLRDLPDRPVAA